MNSHPCNSYREDLDHIISPLKEGRFFSRENAANGASKPFPVRQVQLSAEALYEEISVYRNEGEPGVMHGDFEWSDYLRSVGDDYFPYQDLPGGKTEADQKISFYLRSGMPEEIAPLVESQLIFYGCQTLVEEFLENVELVIQNRFIWKQLSPLVKQFDSIITQGLGVVGFEGDYPEKATLIVAQIAEFKEFGLKCP